MADQENIKLLSKEDRVALGDASPALGKAWGLAVTMNALLDERRDAVNIESTLLAIRELLADAFMLVQGVDLASTYAGAALAVCDMVRVDSQEAQYFKPNSPSMWALEAVPDVVKRAKYMVDNIPLCPPWCSQEAA